MATVLTLYTIQRFFVYETQFQKTIVIIEQQKEEDQVEKRDKKFGVEVRNQKRKFATQHWIKQNRQVIGTRKYIKYCVFERAGLNEDWDVEEIRHSDLTMLAININCILCKHDCSMVPIRPNQMGIWREMESLENLWDVENDPESTSL